MPGQMYGPRKTYLSIAQGAIRQTVSEQTEGAIRRDYEMKDGTKGYKFEFVYKSWEGKIKDIRVKDGKFGEVCEIEFDDAVLSLGTKSRYFMDLIKRLMNANVNRTMTFTPYDFETDGKKLTGVSLVQNGEKIPNYYWDDVNKMTINGMPVPNFNTKQARTRDWEAYWLQVQGFLVDEVEKIKNMIENSKPEQVEDDEKLEEDFADQTIPTVEKDGSFNYDFPEKQNQEDEVRLEDVPF